MGGFEDLVNLIIGAATHPEAVVPQIEPLKYLTPIGALEDLGAFGGVVPAGSTGGDGTGSRWLLGLGAVGVTIAAAPFIYDAIRTRSRGKREEKAIEHLERLENASTRATTLATALLPAFGLPLAYITVQALEERGTITKGLGDAVQTLIAAGAVAPAIGGALGAITKIAGK